MFSTFKEVTSEIGMSKEGDNKSFPTHSLELPVAIPPVEPLSQIDSLVKEGDAVTKMACNAGESTIHMATAATKPVVIPAVDRLSQIDSLVSEGDAVTRMAYNAGESAIDMATAATKPIIDAATDSSLAKSIVKMSQEEVNKSFATRVCELPVATAAVEQLSQIYSSVKERNAVTRIACNAGESTIHMATAATKPIIDAATNCSLSKPIVKKVETAAAIIDHVASETLAKVEEKCPIISKTPAEIKSAVTGTAAGYFTKLQDNATVKMIVAMTGDMISSFELIAELTLPTDGTCEEDMKELETAVADYEKGNLVRAQNLRRLVTRRGKRKLMSYKPKFSADTLLPKVTSSVDPRNLMSCIPVGNNLEMMVIKMAIQVTLKQLMSNVQEKTADVVGKSSQAGKRVYSATMYIPNIVLQLSGDVIVTPLKDFVFALHQAHPITDMPAAVSNCVMKAVQPLAGVKDKLVGYVSVPPQGVIEYVLSSRPIQWIVHRIVTPEDLNNMDIDMEDTTESEETESGKES